MSIYTRPYMRDAQPVSSSIIKILMVANIAVFVFQVILGKNFPTLIFALKSNGWLMKPWTLLTYSFLHETTRVFPWHLLGNMLMLFFIGRALEQQLNNRQLATLYLGVYWVEQSWRLQQILERKAMFWELQQVLSASSCISVSPAPMNKSHSYSSSSFLSQ